MNFYIKKLFAVAAISAVAFFGILAGRYATVQAVSDTNGGSFIETFNNGFSYDGWLPSLPYGSNIYLADNVLYMDTTGIAGIVDIQTGEKVLSGDFDIQVSFQLDQSFYDASDNSIGLSVEAPRSDPWKVRDEIQISLAKWRYAALQVYENEEGSTSYELAVSPSENELEGKLRIKRNGDLFTLYYWKNGWEKLFEGDSLSVTGNDDLVIRFFAINKEQAFKVAWDNLISYYH